MLIWANKSDVNSKLEIDMRTMYGLPFTKVFKAWEFSVILRQIQRHFGDRKDISILDFGVGVSPFGAYLNYLGYQPITCLDKVRGDHYKMNQEEYNKRYDVRIKYIKTDIVSNYDGKHDVIFSASVLEHVENKTIIEVMRTIYKHLNPGGLIIHVVDYDEGLNVKELIENCGVPISYKPEETPGCKEFKEPPEYTWWITWKKRRMEISRLAFFNEKQMEDKP